MFFGIISIFPEMFYSITNYGVIARSIRNGILSIKIWNPRRFTTDRYQKIDDRPYGGGSGMLMLIQPFKKAIEQAKYVLGYNTKVVYLSPQGRRLNQKHVCKFSCNNQALILVCGRYQGIDERLIKMEVDEEWSIGDYILSGGELAAMVLIDTIARMLPGTLNNQESIKSDSFSNNRLDCPYYSRPKNFQGMQVPNVLLSGNHNNISLWRLKQSLGNTWIKRPDLLKKSKLTRQEQDLLTEFKNEYLFSLNKNKVKKES